MTNFVSRLDFKAPSGPYVYGLSLDGAEIFYVGKGRKARAIHHGFPSGRNSFVAKLCPEGNYLIAVLGEYETDDAAFRAEIEFIKKLEPSCNIAPGGAGQKFKNHDLKRFAKERWKKPGHREKIAAKAREQWRTRRAEMEAAIKIACSTPEFRSKSKARATPEEMRRRANIRYGKV